MKYMADDGKVFECERAAKAHDEKIKAEKAKQKQLEEDKQARKDEIKADYDTLMKKVEQYSMDYKEPVTFSERLSAPSRSIRTLFDIFDIFGW